MNSQLNAKFITMHGHLNVKQEKVLLKVKRHNS